MEAVHSVCIFDVVAEEYMHVHCVHQKQLHTLLKVQKVLEYANRVGILNGVTEPQIRAENLTELMQIARQKMQLQDANSLSALFGECNWGDDDLQLDGKHDKFASNDEDYEDLLDYEDLMNNAD